MGDRTAIACALGGPEGRTLFLLSSTDAYPERLVGTKLSRLDAMTVDVPGAGPALTNDERCDVGLLLRARRRRRPAGEKFRRDRSGAQHLVGRDSARRARVGAAGACAGALRAARRHPAEPRADRPAGPGARRGRPVGARATRTIRQADRIGQRRDAGAGPGRRSRGPSPGPAGGGCRQLDTAAVVHAPAPPLAPAVAEARSRDMAKDWDRNYVHSLDWRWLTKPLTDGPGESWLKPRSTSSRARR